VEPAQFLGQILDLYTLVVLVAVVTSWFQLSPDNPVIRLTRALTEPALAPMRKLVPPIGGLDFSPMLLLLLLQMIRGML
jgi:YggT family protein